MSEPKAENARIYPALLDGRWVMSPLAHIGLYADRALRDRESHAAVPVDLLVRVSGYRECGSRRMFTSDEDGPLRAPFEAACRKEQGHDGDRLPDHVRSHSNGYYTWPAERVYSPAGGES